jgi:hypothetical protein
MNATRVKNDRSQIIAKSRQSKCDWLLSEDSDELKPSSEAPAKSNEYWSISGKSVIYQRITNEEYISVMMTIVSGRFSIPL